MVKQNKKIIFLTQKLYKPTLPCIYLNKFSTDLKKKEVLFKNQKRKLWKKVTETKGLFKFFVVNHIEDIQALLQFYSDTIY